MQDKRLKIEDFRLKNMKIQKDKVVTVTYELYVDGEEQGKEELMERATMEHPLTYCHGEGMMLPKFEQGLEGKQDGEEFELRIACEDAYGEYDTDSVLTLDKKLFYNGDGEFDSERVQVGQIVPMKTVDGQVVNAQVVEITDANVTIDLNHPLAGENLHFVGKIIEVRDVEPAELDAIHHPHKCGGCHGGGCHGGDCHCDGGCQ